jgi:hypothetical protein
MSPSPWGFGGEISKFLCLFSTTITNTASPMGWGKRHDWDLRW